MKVIQNFQRVHTGVMEPAKAPSAKRRISAPSHHKPRAPRRPVVAVMPCAPAELSASAAREWDRIGPTLVALGMHPVLDQFAFMAYCRAVGDAEDVRNEWILKGSPTVVVRPAGERPHPALETLRTLASDALRYACQLGLTPRSRKLLNVEMGGAGAAPVDPVAETADDEIARRYFND